MSACCSCGACCAYFRVDFAVYELDDLGGSVPSDLVLEVKGNTARMRGTDHVPMRCIALTGQVGEQVACGIYEARPSPCREFAEGSDGCGRARRKHGMAPLDEIAV
jgi:Fe-S-cluster containining protein